MDNQTQDYITLKPIAERFKEVAMTISNDEIKRIINKYEIVKREISEVGKTVINFKNGSHIDILKPTKNDPVIRGKRADISHWMYDYEAFGISNEDFEKVVEPF